MSESLFQPLHLLWPSIIVLLIIWFSKVLGYLFRAGQEQKDLGRLSCLRLSCISGGFRKIPLDSLDAP